MKIIVIRDGKETDIPKEAQDKVDKYISTKLLIDSYLLEIEQLSAIKKTLEKSLYTNYKIRFKINQ